MLKLLKKVLYEDRDNRIKQLERELVALKKEPTPTMADLMRDILGLPMVDFANVDSEGYPKHPADGMSKDERLAFMGELNRVYTNDAFKLLMEYWINMFGNHSVRNADKDAQPARFSINGIAMLRKELETAHHEVVEASKEDEKFDTLAPLPEE